MNMQEGKVLRIHVTELSQIVQNAVQAALAAHGVSSVDGDDKSPSDPPVSPHEPRATLAPKLIEAEVERKCCGTCKQNKPIDEFGADKSQADGLSKYCLTCTNERFERNAIHNYLTAVGMLDADASVQRDIDKWKALDDGAEIYKLIERIRVGRPRISRSHIVIAALKQHAAAYSDDIEANLDSFAAKYTKGM